MSLSASATFKAHIKGFNVSIAPTGYEAISEMSLQTIRATYIRSPAVKIPPPNIDMTVRILDIEKVDMPLMPWPDVHPPASLAPKTMIQPPTNAPRSDTSAICAVEGIACDMTKLPIRMPITNVIALVEGRPCCFSDFTTYQKRRPASS